MNAKENKYYNVYTGLNIDKSKLLYSVYDSNHSLTGFVCMCNHRREANKICKLLNNFQQAKQDMAERIKKEIEGIENIYSKTYTDKVFEIIDKALENKDNFQASRKDEELKCNK